MAQDVMVLGAGIVGVSVALHLVKRGLDVVLVDRQGPGEATSFGNGGLLQREAVFPREFPQDFTELLRIARNASIDAVYHPSALPEIVRPLFLYWRNSHPARYAAAIAGHARLIETCLDEHLALAREAEATALLRPIGYHAVYGDPRALEAALGRAEQARQAHGVNYAALDGRALAEAEPALQVEKAGAIHWTDPLSCSDPLALTMAYFHRFQALGGNFAVADATALTRNGSGWSVQGESGPIEAGRVVVALGPAAADVTRKLGYAPPTFGKRGYHVHFGLRGNAVLNRPMTDCDNGFLLAPMRAGVRLTTGAEFARRDAPATPVQLARAEPIARTLLPLADQVEQKPWMGVRPCTPDMLPIVGPLPGSSGVWCAFGHAHQGLTLGPTTGRLLADMMTGEKPFVDPAPYRPDRF